MDPQTTKHQRVDELRRKAEEQLSEVISSLDEKASDDVQTLLHDLHVHQIELEIQNEELRRIQAELEISRKKYAALYEFAPVGYCTLEPDGAIREINLTAADQLGQERDALLNTRFYHYIAEEDRETFFLHLRNAFESLAHETCDIRLLKPDDSSFWAQLESQARSERFSASSQDAKASTTNLCCITITDITELKRMEDELRKRLEEREVLLKEVYHRVKNNLSAVSNMLVLQAMTVEDSCTRAVLQDIESRVLSMISIHQHFYQSDNLAEIDFSDCLYNIATELFHAYRAPAAGITLETKRDSVLLPADKAFPCVMLVNELVSNALKYAFPEGCSGTIRLELHEQDGQVTLVVSDDGVGLPEDLELERVQSMGLYLVRSFTCQLQGSLDLDRTNGTTFTLTFPNASDHLRNNL